MQLAPVHDIMKKLKYTTAVRSKISAKTHLCELRDTPIARVAGCMSTLRV